MCAHVRMQAVWVIWHQHMQRRFIAIGLLGGVSRHSQPFPVPRISTRREGGVMHLSVLLAASSDASTLGWCRVTVEAKGQPHREVRNVWALGEP